MVKIILFGIMLLSTPLVLQAHEGHNEGLAQVQPLHGGIPREGKLFHVEVVNEGNLLRVYLLPHKGDSISLADVTMAGKIEFPKSTKKKEVTPSIKTEGDHFVMEADLSQVKRFTLKLNAVYKGKKQDFKLNIEPKG